MMLCAMCSLESWWNFSSGAHDDPGCKRLGPSAAQPASKTPTERANFHTVGSPVMSRLRHLTVVKNRPSLVVSLVTHLTNWGVPLCMISGERLRNGHWRPLNIRGPHLCPPTPQGGRDRLIHGVRWVNPIARWWLHIFIAELRTQQLSNFQGAYWVSLQASLSTVSAFASFASFLGIITHIEIV